MTYVVRAPCIGTKDLSCVDVCPAECIHLTEHMAVIDPDECIDCGACEPACPVSAIVPATALSGEDHEFLLINEAWKDGPRAVEQLVEVHMQRSSPL